MGSAVFAAIITATATTAATIIAAIAIAATIAATAMPPAATIGGVKKNHRKWTITSPCHVSKRGNAWESVAAYSNLDKAAEGLI